MTVCPKCGNAGYITAEKNKVREFVGFCDCTYGKAKKKELWEEKLLAAGIHREYWDLHFANFIGQSQVTKHLQFKNDVEAYLKTIKDQRAKGAIWLIYGSVGTGKTLGASLILKEALKKHYTAKYVVWTDLVESRFEDDDDMIKPLREVEFLVMDDLGRDRISKEKKAFVEDLLEKVIKHRLGNKLPTILISTFELSELVRKFPILPTLISAPSISHVEGLNFRTQTIPPRGRS